VFCDLPLVKITAIMIITITYIRLRNPWLFFKLSLFGYHILKQAKGSKGFIKMKNTGFWLDHYTLSAWGSADDMHQFARAGAHLDAMKQSKEIATQIATYSYPSENFPAWNEAKILVREKGKVLEF
jgi:hypothetical protein